MNTIIKTLLILTLLAISRSAESQPTNPRKLAELKTMIEQKSKFTRENTDRLLLQIENASKEGLPADFLMNRIMEGLTKRAKYSVIQKVINNHIDSLTRAREILNRSKQEFSKETREYYTLYIGELLNRGLKKNEWAQVMDSYVKIGSGIEEASKTCGILVRLTERRIPRNHCLDVILQGIKNNYELKQLERIGQLYIDSLGTYLTSEEIKDILAHGIKKQSGFFHINDDLQEMSRLVFRERKNSLHRTQMEQLREERIDDKRFMERIHPNENNKK